MTPLHRHICLLLTTICVCVGASAQTEIAGEYIWKYESRLTAINSGPAEGTVKVAIVGAEFMGKVPLSILLNDYWTLAAEYDRESGSVTIPQGQELMYDDLNHQLVYLFHSIHGADGTETFVKDAIVARATGNILKFDPADNIVIGSTRQAYYIYAGENRVFHEGYEDEAGITAPEVENNFPTKYINLNGTEALRPAPGRIYIEQRKGISRLVRYTFQYESND